MSKTKRKRYTGGFKAKVGMEALQGSKTTGQIAREYQAHPVQVTQWKGVIRDHLPGRFEPARPALEDPSELIEQLHAKIGQLAVEPDWLKKSASNGVCERPAGAGGTMPRTEPAPPMRVGGDFAQRALLRTGAGERSELGVDAAMGRVESGKSVLWQAAFDRAYATRRYYCQS